MVISPVNNFQRKKLEKIAEGLEIENNKELFEIENEFINKKEGKVLFTKNKKLLQITTLPFVPQDNPEKKFLKKLQSLWFDCNECNSTTGFFDFPFGNLDNPKAFIIGIGPSDGNVNHPQTVFRGLSAGGTATFLRRALIDLDIYDQVWITNLIKCSVPQNRSLLEDEVLNCRYWLIKEFEILKPKVIILLGNQVKEFFRKYYLNFCIRYKIFEVFHPGYFLYKRRRPKDYSDYLKEEKNVKI